MSSTINAGDRVKFARTFLQTIGCFTRGQGAYRTGTVDSVEDWSGRAVAYVQWDDEPQEVSGVLVSNLVRADRLHLESP
jgi:hypothetical protein